MIKWLGELFSDMGRKDAQRRMPDGEPVYEFEYPPEVSISINSTPKPLPPLKGPESNSSHFIVRTSRYDDRGEKLLLKLLYNNWEILTASSFENQAVEYVLRNPRHVKSHTRGCTGLAEDKYCNIKEYVDFIVKKGTLETISGQFFLDYDVLSESMFEDKFKIILPKLVEELRTREEVAEVLEASDDGNVVDIQFYGKYCPNYEKLEGEQ